MVLNFDPFYGFAAIFGAGVALAGVGYVVKVFWGSFIALLAGSFSLLYIRLVQINFFKKVLIRHSRAGGNPGCRKKKPGFLLSQE